jgi:hypothetical protein
MGDSVAPEKSHFYNIYQLPAGHLLTFSNGQTHVIKVDTLSPMTHQKKLNIYDYAYMVKEILLNTIQKRFNSKEQVAVILV